MYVCVCIDSNLGVVLSSLVQIEYIKENVRMCVLIVALGWLLSCFVQIEYILRECMYVYVDSNLGVVSVKFGAD